MGCLREVKALLSGMQTLLLSLSSWPWVVFPFDTQENQSQMKSVLSSLWWCLQWVRFDGQERKGAEMWAVGSIPVSFIDSFQQYIEENNSLRN